MKIIRPSSGKSPSMGRRLKKRQPARLITPRANLNPKKTEMEIIPQGDKKRAGTCPPTC